MYRPTFIKVHLDDLTHPDKTCISVYERFNFESDQWELVEFNTAKNHLRGVDSIDGCYRFLTKIPEL